MIKRILATLAAAAAIALAVGGSPTGAQVLRIAMTASDLPTAGGIPDQGAEGARFAGYPIYDALVNWDFTHPDQIAGLTPGLATEWHINPEDHTQWIFTLRTGVKFHDGTDFDANAVIFNLDRTFNPKSPVYDGIEAPYNTSQVPNVDHYAKLDEDHIAIWTTVPFSPFPYVLTRIMMVSPTQYGKVRRDWTKFMMQPVGTGPFIVKKVTPHVSIELVRNTNYWDATRIPKLAGMILYPMPEATTRLAALRSGQVDWIEVPPPDAIASLKAAGFQISLHPYPHTWPWVLNVAPGSPFADRRVRQALNYGIDRLGLVKLLNGTATPAIGLYDDANLDFGVPTERYTYDPAKAKALLRAAGYGPDHPLKAKIMITPAGSGQMLPLPMNEFLQQNLKPLGVDLAFDVVDWGMMLVARRNLSSAAISRGDHALNNSLNWPDPSAIGRLFEAQYIPPNGGNWGSYTNLEVERLLNEAYASFDEKYMNELIAKAHAIIVDDAPWLFVVHDLNPRAMSPKVKGFVPAQSWFQDFTRITLDK
jgi:peptide/nickel transport system substrate-binding protein